MAFQIDGSSGKYGNSEGSTNYGRNAVSNHLSHMEAPFVNDNNAVPPVFKFTPSLENDANNFCALEEYLDNNDAYLNSLPPLEYEYRYLPNFSQGKLDKEALLGAAYEELGQVKEISVEEFEANYLDENQTAEAIDINKDGKIDLAEYSTTIVAADILSKDTTDPHKADGVINGKGLDAVLEYSNKSNLAAASKLYQNIYNTYILGS